MLRQTSVPERGRKNSVSAVRLDRSQSVGAPPIKAMRLDPGIPTTSAMSTVEVGVDGVTRPARTKKLTPKGVQYRQAIVRWDFQILLSFNPYRKVKYLNFLPKAFRCAFSFATLEPYLWKFKWTINSSLTPQKIKTRILTCLVKQVSWTTAFGCLLPRATTQRGRLRSCSCPLRQRCILCKPWLRRRLAKFPTMLIPAQLRSLPSKRYKFIQEWSKISTKFKTSKRESLSPEI